MATGDGDGGSGDVCRVAWMGFDRSTVVLLYKRVVGLARKRQPTLGCFDPRLWFVSKGSQVL